MYELFNLWLTKVILVVFNSDTDTFKLFYKNLDESFKNCPRYYTVIELRTGLE